MSGPLSTIARNTAVQAVGEMLSKVASLAFYVVMARAFGKALFGDYMFALSLALLLTVFAGFGTDTILTRAVSRDRGELPRMFWSSIALKAGIGVVTVALAVAITLVGDYGPGVRLAVAVLGIASVVDLLTKTLYATFQAHDDLRPGATTLVLQRFATAIVGIAAMALGAKVVPVSVIYLGGSLLALGYCSHALLERDIRPRIVLSVTHARALVVESIPTGLATIFAMVLFRIDATMLSFYKGDVAVGLYGVSYRALESTLFLTYALTSAAMPALSRLRRDTVPPVGAVYGSGLKALVIALAPIGVAFVLFAETILRVLYGEQYTPATTALRWLGGAAALYGVAYLSTYLIIAQDRARLIPWITAGLVIENVALNALLIPRFSLEGAAAVTTITEITRTVVMLAVARRLAGPVALGRLLGGPAAGCAAMALVALLAGTGLAPMAVALALYVVVTAAVERRLFPDDFGRLTAALRRLRPA